MFTSTSQISLVCNPAWVIIWHMMGRSCCQLMCLDFPNVPWGFFHRRCVQTHDVSLKIQQEEVAVCVTEIHKVGCVCIFGFKLCFLIAASLNFVPLYIYFWECQPSFALIKTLTTLGNGMVCLLLPRVCRGEASKPLIHLVQSPVSACPISSSSSQAENCTFGIQWCDVECVV